jgi:hypothetical protein
VASLHEVVAAGDRSGVARWAAGRTIDKINSEVAALSVTDRAKLPALVLDSDAQGRDRERILAAMAAAFTRQPLGFFVEVWAYTRIQMTGSWYAGACGEVQLSPALFPTVPDDGTAVLHILVHESWHSFSHCNGGPSGALDEGAANSIDGAAGFAATYIGSSLGDASYKAVVFNRNGASPPNPGFPLVAPLNASRKYLDVMTWLSSVDSTHLDWTSTSKLQSCFDRYYGSLQWNTSGPSEWAAARAGLSADAACHA